MIRTLLVGAIVVAVLAVIACGGSSSPSSTPTAATPSTLASVNDSSSPTPPPAGSICDAANLYGALVLAQGTAGTEYYTLGVTSVGGVDCILVNPPLVYFKDAAGADLGIPVGAGTDCPTGGPYDPNACVDEDAVDLPPGAATPGVVNGQLSVTLGVTDIETLVACPSPNVQAHFITLRFTGTTEDVRIGLPADIELLTCVNQVRLHGYGPSK